MAEFKPRSKVNASVYALQEPKATTHKVYTSSPETGTADTTDQDNQSHDSDDDILLAKEQEVHATEETVRQQEVLNAQFRFEEAYRELKKKKGYGRRDLMGVLRKQRRLLSRNENLRFRELYKPPEPGVIIAVISIVTIVTLVLTRSWPFY